MDINKYFGKFKDENEKPLDNPTVGGGYCGIFRTIACIGDSLSSGEFESYDENGNRGYHDFFDYSWGQYMARHIGSKVYNFSSGGMTAEQYCTSFADSNGLWSSDKSCQAYIIALGVNDIIAHNDNLGELSDIDVNNYKNNKPTFIGYYATIIQRYKEISPRAKFFLMTIPHTKNEWREEAKNKHRHLMEKLTEIFDNTYLIDLREYGPVFDKQLSEFYFQGHHMNAMGYLLISRIVESYIDYIIRHDPENFLQAGFIGTDFVYLEKEND